MNADYRSCVVDVNLEEHFQEEFSGQDIIERGVLDLSTRTRREKFNENIDEVLDSFPLESTIKN